jgi:hypothetical protein
MLCYGMLCYAVLCYVQVWDVRTGRSERSIFGTHVCVRPARVELAISCSRARAAC